MSLKVHTSFRFLIRTLKIAPPSPPALHISANIRQNEKKNFVGSTVK